jgi:catechol 2,3-dioxygenase-like lactoylglutathione lyase family enzyme
MAEHGLTLDRVVIVVRDLAAARYTYDALLGRRPSWRGRQRAYGTENVLYRLENTYLELLAPAPQGRGNLGDRLRAHLGERGEGLWAVAAGTNALDALVARLRSRGMAVADPAAGEGEDLDTGARRAWRVAFVPVEAMRGIHCFFVEHRSAPDALPPSPPQAPDGAHVTHVDHVVVLSSNLEASRRLWGETLGARLARERDFAERNSRLLFFRLRDVTIEIAGRIEGEGADVGDRLWGVAYEVGDVARTSARLRDAGFDVSEVREGRGECTRVATVRGPACGVPTLLIENLWRRDRKEEPA